MVFTTTFNNISVISWQSVLLMEETGVLEKTTDLPWVTDKLDQLMLYQVNLAMSEIQTHNFSGNMHCCTGSCNPMTITTTQICKWMISDHIMYSKFFFFNLILVFISNLYSNPLISLKDIVSINRLSDTENYFVSVTSTITFMMLSITTKTSVQNV